MAIKFELLIQRTINKDLTATKWLPLSSSPKSDTVKEVVGAELSSCPVVRAWTETLSSSASLSSSAGKLWLTTQFCEQPDKPRRPMSIPSQITVDWKFVHWVCFFFQSKFRNLMRHWSETLALEIDPIIIRVPLSESEIKQSCTHT